MALNCAPCDYQQKEPSVFPAADSATDGRMRYNKDRLRALKDEERRLETHKLFFPDTWSGTCFLYSVLATGRACVKPCLDWRFQLKT